MKLGPKLSKSVNLFRILPAYQSWVVEITALHQRVTHESFVSVADSNHFLSSHRKDIRCKSSNDNLWSPCTIVGMEVVFRRAPQCVPIRPRIAGIDHQTIRRPSGFHLHASHGSGRSQPRIKHSVSRVNELISQLSARLQGYSNANLWSPCTIADVEVQFGRKFHRQTGAKMPPVTYYSLDFTNTPIMGHGDHRFTPKKP